MHRFTIHLIYAGSFLLAVLTVIGYLAWNKHQTAFQAAELARLEATREFQLEKLRELKISRCMLDAAESYTSEWAGACKLNAKNNKLNLEQCLDKTKKWTEYVKTPYTTAEHSQNLYAVKAADCNDLYGEYNPAPDCGLPMFQADKLNDRLAKEKQICLSVNKVE